MTCLVKHLENVICIMCKRSDQVYQGHGVVRFCAHCSISWDPVEDGKSLDYQIKAVILSEDQDGELPEDMIERMGMLIGGLTVVFGFERRLANMMAIPEALFTEDQIKHLPGRHPQSSHGRGGGSISGGPVSKEKRVWQGKRQEVAEGQKLSKLQTGELGEKVAMQALSDINGVPFETLNVGINNAPIDVVGDHQAVEVKTGLVTNGPSSQKWRATIGEPGREEKASYKALIKKMSPETKREHNRLKRQAILDRKRSMLDRLTNEAGGERINPLMVGVIMAPDGKKADVFAVDGFHLSLPWRQAATDENYIGTYDIGE